MPKLSIKRNMKAVVFSAVITAVCLAAGAVTASMYSECLLKARVCAVTGEPRYEEALRAHAVTVRFKVTGVVRGGGFLPSLCNNMKNRTYTKKVILPSAKRGRRLRRGNIVRLKYRSGSGTAHNEAVTWESWTLQSP